jgi:FtsP/CotA-like multicopper oxidase with cupredoxin domain
MFEVSRRGALALAGAAAALTGMPRRARAVGLSHEAAHGENAVVGSVDHAANGFTPRELLTEFDYGTVSIDRDGRTVREWAITAVDKEIEIAPGVFFPAWTYNGRVPGPALRCVEGERLRIVFTNAGTHPHTIHLHSIHPARMDGIPGAGMVQPGETFTYEVEATPFGCHLYHCHALPLKRHIHKGLYGALVIDPDPARPRRGAPDGDGTGWGHSRSRLGVRRGLRLEAVAPVLGRRDRRHGTVPAAGGGPPARAA